MCGINAIYGMENSVRAETLTMQMNDHLRHRGPDAQGIWSNEQVCLGHRRLSIIDTSDAGTQPFFSDDKKIVVVFNGEIYNYIEIKQELSSEYNFTTHSDTEIIIAAYKKWGILCVEHFIGMFAIIIWDDDKESLYIVRDRLGIKPVYYAKTAEGIVFSSELRAILSTGLVDKKISAEAMADYLRYQTVHAPNTIIADVKMLMPGNYMQLNKTGKSIVAYWELNAIRKNEDSNNSQAAYKKIYDLLTSSVELRMRADVPFGAFLSGGIDSSIIVGLMSRISAHPVKTFSIIFYEKEYDESGYSDMIAKKFQTDHTPIRLRAENFLTLVPDALQAMDHPSGDGPNTYVVSKVTREAGVKMALSGLGGDEVFAGYDVFKRMKSLENKKWLNIPPPILRSGMAALLTKIRPGISTEKIANALRGRRIDFLHFYPLTRQLFMDDTVKNLLKPKAQYENAVSRITAISEGSDLPLLSKVSEAEMETYMQNILLRDTDQMSMAHALEVRVPFLDHRLVEYVLGLGDEIKFPHSPKELLTRSVGELIPRQIIDRPKMGFTFPWALWMRNELKSFCVENLKALQGVEVLDYSGIMQLWDRFIAGDRFITWSRMWPLVVLGHWVKQHDVH